MDPLVSEADLKDAAQKIAAHHRLAGNPGTHLAAGPVTRWTI
jgi:hypothetical protein